MDMTCPEAASNEMQASVMMRETDFMVELVQTSGILTQMDFMTEIGTSMLRSANPETYRRVVV